MEALVRYRWPGNVRELQNFIECAVILSLDEIVLSVLTLIGKWSDCWPRTQSMLGTGFQLALRRLSSPATAPVPRARHQI